MSEQVTRSTKCDGCGMVLEPNEGMVLPGIPTRHACSEACVALVVPAMMPPEFPKTPADAVAQRAAKKKRADDEAKRLAALAAEKVADAKAEVAAAEKVALAAAAKVKP